MNKKSKSAYVSGELDKRKNNTTKERINTLMFLLNADFLELEFNDKDKSYIKTGINQYKYNIDKTNNFNTHRQPI